MKNCIEKIYFGIYKKSSNSNTKKIERYNEIKSKLEECDNNEKLQKLSKCYKAEIEEIKHISNQSALIFSFIAIMISLFTVIFPNDPPNCVSQVVSIILLVVFYGIFAFELLDLKNDSKIIKYNLISIDIIEEILQERKGKAQSSTNDIVKQNVGNTEVKEEELSNNENKNNKNIKNEKTTNKN